MRILWILPYSPWPTTSGGKTRQYHLLRSLAARGHRITVLLHSKQPVSAEDRQALEPFLERLVVLPRRPLRSLSTLLAALFAPYPAAGQRQRPVGGAATHRHGVAARALGRGPGRAQL